MKQVFDKLISAAYFWLLNWGINCMCPCKWMCSAYSYWHWLCVWAVKQLIQMPACRTAMLSIAQYLFFPGAIQMQHQRQLTSYTLCRSADVTPISQQCEVFPVFSPTVSSEPYLQSPQLNDRNAIKLQNVFNLHNAKTNCSVSDERAQHWETECNIHKK